MKIAIDGPSASGKGTISKILAEKLNAFYLNTGKIYRIVAFLATKEKGGDIQSNAIEIAKNIDFHFKNESKNSAIYSEENSKITSKIAQIPEIRKLLVKFQRDFAEHESNIILEGRDIGSVIMPNADFKFYLDASPEERARRRMLQIRGHGANGDYEKILFDIKERDKNDSERSEAALIITKDAHYIDTTSKTIDEVVKSILDIIK
jgi:cytidylate kinase